MMPPRTVAAVILAGGYGGRFYPFTKSVPKEMLPVNGVPAIHWVLRECRTAGVGTTIVVHRRDLDLTKRHLVEVSVLDDYLRQTYDQSAGEDLFRKLNSKTRFISEAKCQYGTLGPFLQAVSTEEADAYLVAFADEVFIPRANERTTTQRLVQDNRQSTLISMLRPEGRVLERYGLVEVAEAPLDGQIHKVVRIFQKPHKLVPKNVFPVVSRLIVQQELIADLIKAYDCGSDDLLTEISKICRDRIGAIVVTECWGTVGDPTSYFDLLDTAQQQAPMVDIVEFHK